MSTLFPLNTQEQELVKECGKGLLFLVVLKECSFLGLQLFLVISGLVKGNVTVSVTVIFGKITILGDISTDAST